MRQILRKLRPKGRRVHPPALNPSANDRTFGPAHFVAGLAPGNGNAFLSKLGELAAIPRAGFSFPAKAG
jgi:hypothetical protein